MEKIKNYQHIVQYQKSLENKKTQCLTCSRKCIINDDSYGFCKTRINDAGTLYSINYGCIPAISNNPIEKKPLFHFHPGTFAITIGTYGCNFSCFWCQNHHLSHPHEPIELLVRDRYNYYSPSDIIDLALKYGSEGTSVSFNEPTLLLEYSLELFKLAKKHNLYNTYVTNGYMTEEVLRDLAKAGLDAMNIDIKGDAKFYRKYCGTDAEIVWQNAKLAKELGVHVEITNLLIEGFNTEPAVIDGISKRLADELGEYTPFHITRAFPHYKSKEYGFNEPTPISTLLRAYKIARKNGLKFVYMGNLPSTEFENTVCPNCGKTVIKRIIFGVKESYIDKKGNCQFCGFPICVV
ncbi:MAG: AmmeMemoRadiSam system radical SAM enzyme [Promethearchaeia archaeon]